MPRHLKLIALFALLSISQHLAAQRIFWNEPNNNRIRFGGLTYSALSAGTNLHTGPSGISHISLDPGYNLIFFTEGNGSTLYQGPYSGPPPAADERYIFGAMSEGTDIAYSPNAGGVFATIYEEAGGISFIPETAGASQSVALTGRSNDVFSCIAVDDGSERIFFYDIDQDAIGFAGFSGGTVTDVVGGLGMVTAIDFDDASGKLVFATETGQIYICNDDGTEFDNVTTAAGTVTSLVYYSGYNKIYYVANQTIWSATLDGLDVDPLLVLTGTGVTDLGVEPDQTLPTVSSRYPADGQTGITIGEVFTLDFTEQIRKSADAAMGSQRWVRIIRTADGEPMDTVDRDDPRLVFSGGTLTINDLTYSGSNTEYHILIGNRVVEDMAGNNFVGFTLATQWNFTTELTASKFYSRQSGNWNDPNTWSFESHSGIPAGDTPGGTGMDAEIGPGHTVTLTANASLNGASEGLVVQAGGVLDMAGDFELNVWGYVRINGTLLNGGVLSGIWNLHSAALPIFKRLEYGVVDYPDQQSTINCNVVSYEPTVSVDGGTLNTGTFEVCTPPAIPTSPTYAVTRFDEATINWAASGGNQFIVIREQGTAPVKPEFETAYSPASAAFGTGAEIGTGNFLAYTGTGNSVTVTGLSPLHTYEIDMYGYNTSIGGCYSLNNYQSSWFNSCAVVNPPVVTIPDTAYCTGDVKPAFIVYQASTPQWFDAPSGGNIVTGTQSFNGMWHEFIPDAASGTFYLGNAEYWEDVPATCASTIRVPMTLTMLPALVPGTATGVQNVCSGGDPTVLSGGTATGGDGNFTYQWASSTTAGGPYIDISTNGTNATYDPPAGLVATTYFIRRVRSATCAEDGNQITVTVVTPPTIVTPPANRNVCGSAATAFNVIATGTSLTYQWQVDNGTGFTNITNGGVYSGALTANLAISNTTGLNGYKYQCIVTAGLACQVTTAFGTLNVSPLPVALDQPVSLCEGIAGSGTVNVNLLDYNASITGGDATASVVWYDDNMYTSAVATPNNVSATHGRIYYPRVFGANLCTDDAVFTVSIITKPEVTPAPADKIICSGASTALTFTSVPAGATYTWTITPNANITGAAAGSGSGISQNLTNSSTTQQLMQYSLVPTLGTCDGPAFTQKVFVDPVPTAFTVSGGGTFCTGGIALTVGLSGSQNGLTYSLFRDGAAAGQTLTGNGAALTFTNVSIGGAYTVTATSAANCNAPMTGSASVVVSSAPTGAGVISGPIQLCLGQEHTVTVTGVTGATAYEWILPAGVEAVSPGTTSSLTIVITSEISNTTLIAIPSNACGNGTNATKNLSSLPVPSAVIIPPAEDVYIGEPVAFSFTSASTITSVLWSFGDGQTSDSHTPEITYSVPGDYNVDLEVSDGLGCTNTIREPIVVRPEAALDGLAIKNVITANGDGSNDVLYIEDIAKFTDNEVIVIDRWGKEVFRQKNYDNQWDMKNGSDYLPAGNYVCIVKSNGKSYTRTITVLKQ
jgi:gliding motility-associated-like protein